MWKDGVAHGAPAREGAEPGPDGSLPLYGKHGEPDFARARQGRTGVRHRGGDGFSPREGLRVLRGAPILNHMVQLSSRLDAAFAALSDPTRRGILARLGQGNASISELALGFDMTLTGIKKHVRILELAGLVTTEKVGRVRQCQLGPRRLDDEAAWIEEHRRMVEERLDRLDQFLKRTKGTQK